MDEWRKDEADHYCREAKRWLRGDYGGTEIERHEQAAARLQWAFALRSGKDWP